MRGILDLAIARLAVPARQKINLCRSLNTEEDLHRITGADFAALLCASGAEQGGQAFLNFDEEGSTAILTKDCTRAWQSIETAVTAAEKDAAFLQRQGLSFVSIVDEAYPALLKTIYDPPAVLFYRGCLDMFTTPLPCLAIVGTRKPSGDAMVWTYKTVRPLAAAGVKIVSGLALGIDAQAHRGAVDAGGLTCAVLGTSIDNIYPKSNRPLAAKILENSGVIISEYPPLTKFMRWHFPERNRIIAGLCQATIVVEAGKKSGALITADFALEQNREVWVAAQPPPDTGQPPPAGASPDAGQPPPAGPAAFGDGCRRLLDEGAQPVYAASGILPQFGLNPPAALPPAAFSKNALAASLARELA